MTPEPVGAKGAVHSSTNKYTGKSFKIFFSRTAICFDINMQTYSGSGDSKLFKP